MKSRILTGIAAFVLLCAASAPVMAAKAKAGSVDPPASGAASGTSESTESTEGSASAEATPKKVKKAKRRHHRYWRHRYGYFPFFIPPPRYWFRPWPHYRYRHHRYRRHWGFPFFFRW